MPGATGQKARGNGANGAKDAGTPGRRDASGAQPFAKPLAIFSRMSRNASPNCLESVVASSR